MLLFITTVDFTRIWATQWCADTLTQKFVMP